MESTIEASESRNLPKTNPPLPPKPGLTPKPFSLQKNSTIRSISAPKSASKTTPASKPQTGQTDKTETQRPPTTAVTNPAKKLPQPLSAPKSASKTTPASKPQTGQTEKTETQRPPTTAVTNPAKKLPQPLSAPKSASKTTPTSKPQTGQPKTSDAKSTPITAVTTPAEKLPQRISTPKPQPASVLPKSQPEATKVSEAHPLNENTLGTEASAPDSATKTTAPKEELKSESLQKDAVIQTNNETPTDVVASSEQKDGEEKEIYPSISVSQKTEESSSDTLSTNNSLDLRGSIRKRLPKELTSKFESGGVPLPPQPLKAISKPIMKDNSDKPESSDTAENQATPEPPIKESDTDVENFTGGNSIKKRISLLFDSVSKPEVMTRREELEITNGIGGVKEQIKSWAAETGQEDQKVEKKPQARARVHSKGFEPLEENLPETPTVEVSATEEIPTKPVDANSTVSSSTESKIEPPKEARIEDKPLENATETPAETEKPKEADVQLRRNHLAAADEKDLVIESEMRKKKKAKRRSVRFGTVVADDGGPPVMLSPEPESSEDEKQQEDVKVESKKEEEVDVSMPIYRRVGILQSKDEETQREETLKHLQFEQKQEEEESKQARLKMEEEQKRIEEEEARQKEKRQKELERKQFEEDRREMERMREEQIEKERQMEQMRQKQIEEERERERVRLEEEVRKEARMKEKRERQRQKEEQEVLIQKQKLEEEQKQKELEQMRLRKEEERLRQEQLEKQKLKKEEEEMERLKKMEEEETKRRKLEEQRRKDLDLIRQRKEEEERIRKEELEKQKLRQEEEEREQLKRLEEEETKRRELEEQRRKELDLMRKTKEEEERLRKEQLEKQKLRQEEEERQKRRRLEEEERMKQEDEERKRRELERKMHQEKEEEEDRKRKEERKIQMEKERVEELRRKMEEDLERQSSEEQLKKLGTDEEKDKEEENLINFDTEDFSQPPFSPSSNISENTESLIDVVYDDFSVQDPHLDVDFDDFSVKTTKWAPQPRRETPPIISSDWRVEPVNKDNWLVSFDSEPQESQQENVPKQAEKQLIPIPAPQSPEKEKVERLLVGSGVNEEEEERIPVEDQPVERKMEEEDEEEGVKEDEKEEEEGVKEEEKEEEEGVKEDEKEEEEKMEIGAEVEEEHHDEPQVNSFSTNDEDEHTETLLHSELPQQDEIPEQMAKPDSPAHVPDPVPDVSPEDVDDTDCQRELDLAPFPEISTPLLDTSTQRSKAALSRRRTRSRPSRSLRLGSIKTPRVESSVPVGGKENESDSEEEPPKSNPVSAPPTSAPKVPMFPGLSPAALLAGIKKKTAGGATGAEKGTIPDSGGQEKDCQNKEVTPPPSQVSGSPRLLAGAARVLPPIGSKEGSNVSSPAWLKELKSKKRMSQYNGET